MAELQTRLSLEEQREEERGKEVFTFKQKLTEAETARDSLKKEVRLDESERTIPDVFFTVSHLILLFLNAALHDSEAPCRV